MMGAEDDALILDPATIGDPALQSSLLLAALQEARTRTLDELAEVTDTHLDVDVPNAPNTIGTLLYHVALIEADWLVADILGPESGVEIPPAWFPMDDRDEEGTLSRLRGETLAQHLDRLAAVRGMLLEHLTGMTDEELHRRRTREDGDVTAAWVLHHLLQHEAEHRAHIAWVRDVQLGTIGADRR